MQCNDARLAWRRWAVSGWLRRGAAPSSLLNAASKRGCPISVLCGGEIPRGPDSAARGEQPRAGAEAAGGRGRVLGGDRDVEELAQALEAVDVHDTRRHLPHQPAQCTVQPPLLLRPIKPCASRRIVTNNKSYRRARS